MPSFGGSLRQAGISPSRALRPDMPRRAPSTSSEASYGSDGSSSDDQFAFSAGNTPSHEYPASRPGMVPEYSATSAPRDTLLFGKQAPATISDSSDALRLARSRPIAIELPPARKASIDPESASATTPPAPLSGRGDIPGGYFPLHEDPKLRVHRPHPFHLDTTKARRRSLQRAAEAMKAPSPVATMLEPTQPPIGGFGSAASSSTHTPLSSYIPTGDQAALPLGKYYPSNYERRPANNARQHLTAPGRTGAGIAAKSESHVPVYRHDAAHTSSHTRTNSDVKRRLQQYQRDMVAQATMAASALLANKSSGAENQPDILTTIQGIPLPGNVQRGGAMIKTHKPVSPRLAPLGSPGPVTPMSLESEADGYLALDRGSKTDRLQLERERLEERGSPVAEWGAPISV